MDNPLIAVATSDWNHSWAHQRNKENALKEDPWTLGENKKLDAPEFLFNPGQRWGYGSGKELLRAHGYGR
jgi:hypothetical protein